mmetsp:Transcript_78461/g.96003  ORF Transcript_78461/g.96003 Transcript_78461/m.96003 type:complete len:225 (+) Transcript_78461:27-701(+)
MIAKYLFWFTSLLLITINNCDERNHMYNDGDAVIVWANVMGPFNNPSETYPYYNTHVPFCSQSSDIGVKHDEFHYSKFDGLGSVLQGNKLKNSGLKVEFRQDTAKKVDDCKMKLNIKQAKMLASAIKDKYWYQMYLDDLPLWGIVGEYLPLSIKPGEHVDLNLMNVVDEHVDYDYLSGKEIKTYPHIFTHKSLSISYNANRIIPVDILIAVTKDDSEALELKMT